MSRVAQWLEMLGLAEYAERFVKNRMDFSVLRELSDARRCISEALSNGVKPMCTSTS
jgi:hypothetical protein